MVEIEKIVGEEKVLKRVWASTLVGNDFNEAAEKHGLKVEKTQLKQQDISAEEARIIDKMEPGDTSSLSKIGEEHALLRLVSRSTGKKVSLDEVRSIVRPRVAKEKFEETLNKYITKLRERTSIDVDMNAWERLLKESNNETPK